VAFAVGWPDGSSPISVEFADGYFSDRGVTAWTDVSSDSAKEAALTRATDYVKAMFANRLDPDVFLVVNDVVTIPEELARAVAEYALVELVTPGGLAPAPTVDASGYTVVTKREKIGPLETEFAIAGGDSAKRLTRRSFPLADALMASLLLPSSSLTRTSR
jgi:hypothetical protein